MRSAPERAWYFSDQETSLRSGMANGSGPYLPENLDLERGTATGTGDRTSWFIPVSRGQGERVRGVVENGDLEHEGAAQSREHGRWCDDDDDDGWGSAVMREKQRCRLEVLLCGRGKNEGWGASLIVYHPGPDEVPVALQSGSRDCCAVISSQIFF